MAKQPQKPKALPAAEVAGLNGTAPDRTPTGQFADGNRFGAGNPHNKRAHQLRAVLLGTVSDDDIVVVTKKLIEMARAGDLPAMKELFDRVMGKPLANIEISKDDARERLEEMTDDELLRIARGAGASGD